MDPVGRLGRTTASCPFAALGACVCAVSWATWRLFTGARAVCGLHVLFVVVSPLPPPNFLSFLFFLLCICFFSLVVFCLFLFLFFSFLKWKRGRVHTAGTCMGKCSSGAVVL